ncbi:MAG TPA: DEAD/DEAH box helicase [Roseiarcus sp.]|nr:DEAD/DEAH box helicase [Roseiarcus sp.]
MTQFTDLGLPETLLQAVTQEGYLTPSPIQSQAIPPLLQGRDLLGIAQTGTGKTAAFALPMLARILADRRRPAPGAVRMLVLAPTRELAAQIADSFRAYGRFMRPALQVGVIVGGVSARPQTEMLARGVEVLVATPGRLLDLLATRRDALSRTEVLVLDEADHMLDLGFIIPIRRVVAMLPKARQTLLFSATMPKEIAGLAGDLLRDPAQVSVAPVATTVEKVDQRVVFVHSAAKRDILTELMRDETVARAIVFTRTKHGADRVVQHLEKAGVGAQAIHGNKSQNQRVRALDGFRRGATRVLVATDIAARGIDVDGVTHVVNFELPDVPEAYVHRIGRTARAGASGQAISLCDNEERPLLRQIERLTRQTLPFTDRRGASAPAGEAASDHAGGAARPNRGGEGATRRGAAPRGGNPGRSASGPAAHSGKPAAGRSARAQRFRGV